MQKEILDYKLIGERIRQARKQKGWTQEKVAEKLGITVMYFSRVERGSTKVNLKRLMQIAEILDVQISEFIYGTKFKEETYLDKDMSNILASCTPEKQRMIYNVAKIIAGIDFRKER